MLYMHAFRRSRFDPGYDLTAFGARPFWYVTTLFLVQRRGIGRSPARSKHIIMPVGGAVANQAPQIFRNVYLS